MNMIYIRLTIISILCLYAHHTNAKAELPCKKAYDTCWCATPVASTQGICVPSLSGKGVFCDCTIVQTDDEIKKRQQELFEQAPDELFYNPGGPTIPLAVRKQKGAQIKAELQQELDEGKITHYSTKIPIGARLNTDYACSQASAYSCGAFQELLTSGKLGTAFVSKEGKMPPAIFNRYNKAISQICDEIQGGTFMKNDILFRSGWKKAPQQTMEIMTSPCARFINILQQSNLMPPSGVKEDAITKREKAAINAICAAPQPEETMKNNDPCLCGDERQPQSLKPGLCQVNKHFSTDTLSCHCED
jgi:hypothetical protein